MSEEAIQPAVDPDVRGPMTGQRIAEAIELERQALGLSHTEMACRIGVSYPTYLHHRANPGLALEPRTRAAMLRTLGRPDECPLSSASPTMADLETQRVARVLSYQQMAQLLGVNRRTYWQLLHGRVRMAFRTCGLAAELLGKDPRDVLGQEGYLQEYSGFGQVLACLMLRAGLSIQDLGQTPGGANVVSLALRRDGRVPYRSTVYGWGDVLEKHGVDPSPLYSAFHKVRMPRGTGKRPPALVQVMELGPRKGKEEMRERGRDLRVEWEEWYRTARQPAVAGGKRSTITPWDLALVRLRQGVRARFATATDEDRVVSRQVWALGPVVPISVSARLPRPDLESAAIRGWVVCRAWPGTPR
jgi:transcriptional regulator with XRE-family HTH domain